MRVLGMHPKFLVTFASASLMLAAGVDVARGQSPECEPGPWEFDTPMPLPREATSAAKDNDGRIYIPGGCSGPGPSGPYPAQSTVMRYDEVTDTWEILPWELNIPRRNSTAVSDHLGRIYAIGGFNRLTGEYESVLAVDRFDPEDPEAGWSIDEVPPLPAGRWGPRAVTDSTGKIYLVGGDVGWDEVLRSVLILDPNLDPSDPGWGWQHHSYMVERRTYPGVAIDSQDRIYALGGAGPAGVLLDTAERFDPATGSWSYIDSLSSSRVVGVAVADSCDFIYAIGGWEPGYTCEVQLFNPATDIWEGFAPIRQCRNNMAGILGDSGRLYTFGGDAGFTSQTTVEFFETCVCEQQVRPLDIKPASCPNPLNPSSHGVVPVALVGTEYFDVTMVDIPTVWLSRSDGVGGEVAPNEGPPGPHSVFEDVAAPFTGQPCDCHHLAGDGIIDLSMKFRTDDVVEALELSDLSMGDEVELIITGSLLDGTEFTSAGDCVLIVPRGVSNLIVTSSVPGAFIEVSPANLCNVDDSGFADFQRDYTSGTAVTLTAPEMLNDLVFSGWEVDGTPVPSVSGTVSVTLMEAYTTAEAVYVPGS